MQMRSDLQLENLFRALALAAQRNEPYVPYDEAELASLLLNVAKNHIPVDKGNLKETEWKLQYLTPIQELTGDSLHVQYQAFLKLLTYYVNQKSPQIGIMVLPNYKGFSVYYKVT
jgi:hypothetical protein